MATMKFARQDGEEDPRPDLIRIVLDDGKVLDFKADAGAFSLALADHKAFSVESLEPAVRSPRAS